MILSIKVWSHAHSHWLIRIFTKVAFTIVGVIVRLCSVSYTCLPGMKDKTSSSWLYNVSNHAQTIHWKDGVKLCILSTSRIQLEWHGYNQWGNILAFFQIRIDQVLKWLLGAPFQIPKHIIKIWIKAFFVSSEEELWMFPWMFIYVFIHSFHLCWPSAPCS